MKILLVLCSLVVCTVFATPVPDNKSEIDMLRIPLEGDKELDVLTVAENHGEISERNKRTIGMLRQLFPQLSEVKADDAESLMEATDINDELTRVARGAQSDSNESRESTNTIEEQTEEQPADQQTAESQASDNQSSAIDELSLDNDEPIEDDNRNKRFLNFGFGSSGGSGGSGGGGSGNFLFDIIRRTADRAARAAGTVYRVVAGTETLGAIPDIKTPRKTTKATITSKQSEDINSQEEEETTDKGGKPVLVGGGSGTEQSDERANSPDSDSSSSSASTTKSDGYTEGIPGPVTRLFVLANRGLSNLIQDLILRIAQTSERVVNFKARLITSLI